MRALTVREIAAAAGGNVIFGDENIRITAYSSSSKQAGPDILFVPVIGEHVDAHDYIADAYRNGCRAAFTSRRDVEAGAKGMTLILVDHTVFALQRLGAYYRDLFLVPVIGITGSVGKTTTKEMVAAALETKRKVLKTVGSMNSQVTLPMMILQLDQEHQAAVIEMGMSLPGEMARLTKVSKPETAVITNIGVSHIGQLGTMENIRKEKLCIIDSFQAGDRLLINGDDEMLAELITSKAQVEVYEETKEKLEIACVEAYGTKPFCKYRAKEIRMEGEGIHFLFCSESEDGTAIREEIELNVPGMHNVLNALAALAVAMHYGVPPKEAKKGLLNYQPITMRGYVEHLQDFILIDDTYNASPDSMRGALSILKSVKSGRKIAVLADILELGSKSEECHREVGAMAADCKLDLVVTIGIMGQIIAEEIRKQNAGIEVESFLNNNEASDYLGRCLKAGDACLLKGSRGMKLEEISSKIRENFKPSGR